MCILLSYHTKRYSSVRLFSFNSATWLLIAANSLSKRGSSSLGDRTLKDRWERNNKNNIKTLKKNTTAKRESEKKTMTSATAEKQGYLLLLLLLVSHEPPRDLSRKAGLSLWWWWCSYIDPFGGWRHALCLTWYALSLKRVKKNTEKHTAILVPVTPKEARAAAVYRVLCPDWNARSCYHTRAARWYLYLVPLPTLSSDYGGP